MSLIGNENFNDSCPAEWLAAADRADAADKAIYDGTTPILTCKDCGTVCEREIAEDGKPENCTRWIAEPYSTDGEPCGSREVEEDLP